MERVRDIPYCDSSDGWISFNLQVFRFAQGFLAGQELAAWQ